MLGRDHALSGALVLAALAPVLHLPVEILPAGVVLGAGAGVLPDIDHPDSSISRTFGFLTEGFSWLIHKLSGGHRHGTHSIIGIAVFTAGAYAAGALQAVHASHGWVVDHKTFTWDVLPALLYMALLYSSALRALHIGGHHGDLFGIAAAAATIFTGADLARFHLWHWSVPLLALATGLGCAAHIAGDELTHGGCPILWPVSQHEFHLLPRPLQITTAKLCETWVVFPLLVIALVAALWHATGHPLWVTTTKTR
ncbi:MAG: metal-dependent hydrolase [Trebonia sp.]